MKAGKITRSLKYDLNQIPYDYTVEVTNRLKGLDLIDRLPEELWMEVHNIVQEAVTKIIPKKMKCKKEEWFSVEALQIVEKRSKRQGRKGKIYPTECRGPEHSKERYESLLFFVFKLLCLPLLPGDYTLTQSVNIKQKAVNEKVFK